MLTVEFIDLDPDYFLGYRAPGGGTVENPQP